VDPSTTSFSGTSFSGTSFSGFRPAALRFLRGLARQNTKPWFEANRAVYENEVRNPLRALVEEMDVRLAAIAPEIVGDPQRSVFRIHRDIRFSQDKSPYKTNAGCWFAHRDAGSRVGQESEGGSAGFYFHLEPGSCFVAGGLWMPPRPSLQRIREAIVRAPGALESVASEPRFTRRFGAMDGDASLVRVPRGYPPDHPAAAWLKRRSFTASASLEETALGSRRLLDRLARDFALLTPLVRWLNAALGYRPAASRL
jgi:uncharacterized protein (TIGR02453 family)